MQVNKQWRGFILLEMSMLLFLEMLLLMYAGNIVAFGHSDTARFALSLLVCCAMSVAVLLVFHTGKWGVTALGFFRRDGIKQVLLGILLAVILLLSSAAIGVWMNVLHLGDEGSVIPHYPFHVRRMTLAVLYQGCYLFVFAAVQELLFRGYFYSRLKMLTRLPWLPMIGAAFLYVIFQLPLYPNPTDLVWFWVVGLFFGACRWKLKSCSVLTLCLASGLFHLCSYLL
jgi:hypothetical protein